MIRLYLRMIQEKMELITLELRPRLQSCNVFIAVRKNLSLRNVRVKLLKNNIILTFEDCDSINFLLPSVKIIPTSLSMLNVTNNWICFRLQTAPLDSVFGSFSTEVVTCPNKSVQLASCSRSLPEDIKSLFKETACCLLCACCKNVISKPIAFRRILPFPDAEYNPDEWFCCKHSSDTIKNNIEPQERDYLYGSYFSILHRDIFQNNLNIDNKILTCGKCLLHIGTPHAHNMFKMWNHSVDYKSQDNASSIVNATDPLDDFLILIKDSLSDVLGEEIVLQSSIGKEIHYLLIKPMDCKLNLITEPDNKAHSDINTISLQQKCVAKVLYKYDTNKIATTTNYSNIKLYEVGLLVIEAGLKHLLFSTNRLPHAYRTVADYFLGYIVLQETVN